MYKFELESKGNNYSEKHHVYDVKVNDIPNFSFKCPLRINHYNLFICERICYEYEILDKHISNLLNQFDTFIINIEDAYYRSFLHKDIKKYEFNEDGSMSEIVNTFTKVRIDFDNFNLSFYTKIKEMLAERSYLNFNAVLQLKYYKSNDDYLSSYTELYPLYNSIEIDISHESNNLNKRVENIEKLIYMPDSIGFEDTQNNYEELCRDYQNKLKK